ncbi:TerC family protein [Mycobacterium sp. KBS0706]|uniref:TerC family protein n=1 Tax=Mycobacterium sp. KBS0706 TaxID=2578109 RepID=UPI00110F8BF2|nr:TerC family protein [Mycobacterium sp. KBS0706]TSD85017.1 TerC family protein [Mycobacterium sp. KBS0706]
MESLGPELLKLVQIIWINIILSGDNAVVIAMACRGLPADKQRPGMVLGALVAVVLRVVFTVVVAALLSTPFLKIVGGCLLLWISVKLVLGEDEEGGGAVQQTAQLWHAIRTVAIADAVMSLDNVLAIAAVAKDSATLLITGLIISVPLIVAGAAVIMTLLSRLPILVWAGAALLGWVAGDMLVSDPWLLGTLGEELSQRIELPAAAIGAVFVVALGYVLSRRAARHKEQEA